MTVVEFLLQTLERHGVRYIFGNPGTTELPLVRACERRRGIEYIVALSEVAATPMADGYARASRSLGVLNLHVAPGLGNGMGGLYTARIAQSPLLVLIGGQDRRFLHTEPILWGPVEKMAATVAKSVFTLNNRHDVAFNIRAAVRASLTRPFSPVALVCPPDLLGEDIDTAVEAVTPPLLAALSTAQAKEFARVLGKARRAAIIAGEDVHWSGGAAELERLAAALRAPVYVAPYTGALPVSSASPWYAGYLPPSRKQIADRLAGRDTLFFVGGRGMRTTLYSEARLAQPKLWIGNDPGVLASEGEFTLAAVTEIRDALAQIRRALPRRRSTQRAAPTEWRPKVAVPRRHPGVLHPSRAIRALLEAFGDAIWFDESGLSTSDVRQWMTLPAGEYFINGSGGIGWGLAAAVGAAVAHPERQVVAIVGDGSALYASEALWTAAHRQAHLLVVILANGRYATLNEAAGRLTGKPLVSFSIEPPRLDFSGLATLYGWGYHAVATEQELGRFLEAAGGTIAANTLVEIALDPDVKPVMASRHF
jgi:benzoylformate decarboxylase